MSTTTFKNLLPRRKYRERSQPSYREKKGFLEKKQDYVNRAKHYHRKEEKLKQLKLKASLKNDEEYYFKMNKAHQNKEGKVEIESEESDDDFDVKEYKKILKTKNQNIVKIQKQKDSHRLSKMQQELQSIDAPKQNKQIIFVDDKEQFDNFNLAEYYQTIPEMLNQKSNILKTEQLQNNPIFENPEQVKQITSQMKVNYNKLQKVQQNEKKMGVMMEKIGVQKSLLTKEKRKLKRYKAGKLYKFFKDRKR